MSNLFAKYSGSLLDYEIDWSLWLVSDTIASSDWTLPIALTEFYASFTNSSATIWLSGGTPGEYYTITNTITTAGGRTNVQPLVIEIIA